MRWSIAAVTVAFAALGPATASAAVFSVNTTADLADAAQDGVCDANAATPGEQCTLRAAIREANATVAEDRVDLPGGTFALGSQLAVTSSVEIAGDGARSTAVTGASLTFGGTCDSADGLCTAELSDLTVKDGGGITSSSHLSLARVTVRDNLKGPTTGLAPFGGGVFVGAVGAAVASNLTIVDSTISGNRVVGFPAFLTNGMGGGVAVVSVGTVTITNSTIAGNSATGGDALGGGIGFQMANVIVRSSTVAGNTASATTGLASGGNLYRTVAADAPQPGTLVLRDSIVSGGSVSGPGTNVGSNCSAGAVTGQSGRNIDSGSTCALASPSLSNTDPMLSVLGDHGGPTDVAPPAESSPALNAALSACPVTDQRGVTRPQGGACDIGAVERVRAGTPPGDDPPGDGQPGSDPRGDGPPGDDQPGGGDGRSRTPDGSSPPGDRCARALTGTRAANVLEGTPFGDLIRGGAGNDRLFGGGGADCLAGQAGSDRLWGGGGADTLRGDGGNDVLDARGGGRDVISCGGGRDRVKADRADRIRPGCERVSVR